MPGASAESFNFDADIQQLLRLIITAFYSDKSVFLRELLSNASDALDKLRVQQLKGSGGPPAAADLRIRVTPDKEARTLAIEDSGIGMTREELVQNLGTVAKSGTKAFMDAMQKGADARLIGQFGVGFYSAFLVADRVTVSSKHQDGLQHVWDSKADGSFTVAQDDSGPALQQGTRVVLHMKEEAGEFLDEPRLRALISRHCSFISFPIDLLVTKTVEEDLPAGEAVVEELPGDDAGAAPAAGRAGDGKEPEKEEPKKVKKEVQEFEHVNQTPPIWAKSPSEVTEQEYKDFYKAISQDWDDFAVKRHFVGEGTIEYQALLYVPRHAPFDMLMGVNQGKQKNVKLYARKVLIMDEFDEFLPSYLSFVKGVVNSDDIPLNVSREFLQDNKVLKFIGRNLVRRCLEMFSELAEDAEAYKSFYSSFSTSIKLGIHEDSANRGKLLELLRFPSNKTIASDAEAQKGDGKAQADPMAGLMGGGGYQGATVSLKQYVERVPKEQEEIYVITGATIQAVDDSPFMESFKQKGLEVLYLTEPIDEYVMSVLADTPYEGKKLVNITKAGVKVAGSKEEGGAAEEEKAVCELIKGILDTKVEKVEVSRQLVQSPCVLVNPQYGYSANMERIMRAQALQSQEQRFMLDPSLTRRTMQINPDHDLIKWLKVKAGADAASDEHVRDTVQLLFDTALMSSGFGLDEPAAVATRIQKFMVSKL